MGIATKINTIFQRRKLRLKNKFLTFRYQKNKSPNKFDWDWKAVNFNRIALVNYLVGLKGIHCAYLEIGCDSNMLFDSVACLDKTGIDPFKGGTLRMTSDNFFKKIKKNLM